MGKPILCVDFDGVLHAYDQPWAGPHRVLDGPVPGAMAWLLKALKVFDVQIYSSRSSSAEGRVAMVEALRSWMLEYLLGAEPNETTELLSLKALSFVAELRFPSEKPPAFLTIDDRAIQFQGSWEELNPELLLLFKPWNKRS